MRDVAIASFNSNHTEGKCVNIIGCVVVCTQESRKWPLFDLMHGLQSRDARPTTRFCGELYWAQFVATCLTVIRSGKEGRNWHCQFILHCKLVDTAM